MTALNIFGAYDTRDLRSVAVADFTEFRVAEAIQAFLDQWNANVALWFNTIVAGTTTDVATNFASGYGGTMQKEGEYGDGEATKGGAEWSVAYPVDAFHDKKLYTQRYLDEATLFDINRDVVAAAASDAQTLITEALKAILKKTNYTFNDSGTWGRRTGNLTVRRLVNNDASEGSVFKDGVAVPIGTRTHYITNANASLTVGAFTAARDKLREVGLGEDIVYLVGKTTADSAEALTGFVAKSDPTIILGPGSTTSVAIVASPRARGRIANGEVVEMPGMPEGYIIALDRAAELPVVIREHHLAKYQGLRLVADDTRAPDPSHPLLLKKFRRVFGAAVRNRVNGVAVFVDAGGTYTDPTL